MTYLFAFSIPCCTNMKFSHFVELITVIKPRDEFYLETSYNVFNAILAKSTL